MTRSREKMVNQAMGLHVQSTMDDIMISTRKETSFMSGSKDETTWINMLQAAEDGVHTQHCATAQCNKPCGRMWLTETKEVRFE